MRKIIFILAILFISCKEEKPKLAQNFSTAKIEYELETIVPNTDVPWGMVFLPDNSILYTERKGELIHFKNNTKTKIEGLPEIYVRGQGGLLDVELHPNYKNNGWIYLSFSSDINNKGGGGNTTILRGKIENNTLVNKEIIYKATPNFTNGTHFGSRITFDNDGFLFFSIGDRYNRNTLPQDITKDAGKIYRLNDDGTIPKDNPFVNTKNAKKAIYSYGHRNPQGMVLHPNTGKIWTHEHGPQGGDEINIIKAGKNYGWPKASYGVNYGGSVFTEHKTLPGMENPIHYWVPSIAPSGMEFVTSNIYPEWKGNLLVGSLKFQYLNRCIIKNNKVVKEIKMLEGLGRVRSIKQSPDGFIYVGIEHKGIVKIIPKK
ncbi:PQQ-dependent sugar dehydrogenase [Lutibacter sp. TH_r2]|uniref:PQQ-dependent sugar dehydrogenase n=1 Tax=Lutibacter sp. TH_r2 TaxID=3082083 RepID=UPI0029543B8C|nr:PQQ-dependent sugar dehydrogenase [Lutibacter sp. TH_r2]MDV7186002.1 PQQ-dependent sugar dehydrogenase [Lutibacter sp. TH_r2]